MRAKNFLCTSWWQELPATWRFPDISRANLWNCVIVARPEYYFATARNIFLSHTKIFPATKIQFAGLKQDYRVADPCKHAHTLGASHWADTKLSAKQGKIISRNPINGAPLQAPHWPGPPGRRCRAGRVPTPPSSPPPCRDPPRRHAASAGTSPPSCQ